MSELLQWVGLESAEELSNMAHQVLFEVYTYVPLEGVKRFYEETQTRDAIKDQMSKGYHYAFIIHEGLHIGYVAYFIEDDTMELSKYYILKGHRGAGIGSKVLDEIISIARDVGVGDIRLHVNKWNEGAMRIYGRKGFKVVREVPGYNTVVVDMDMRIQ